MPKVLFLFAAALAFGVPQLTAPLGTVGSSLVLIALGVALAVAASGSFQALAIASGALGAFGSAVVTPASAIFGGALLVGFAYAERSARIRRPATRIAHVVVALVGGAFAGLATNAFVHSSITVHVVGVIVVAVLVALPLLIDADDPIAHALDGAARLVCEPSRSTLHEGAELRRTAWDVPLGRSTARQVRKTWLSLLRLAEARARLERRPARAGSPADTVTKMVEERIRQHVAALARTIAAVDAASAAYAGLDDTAVRSVEHVGESMEDFSEALVQGDS